MTHDAGFPCCAEYGNLINRIKEIEHKFEISKTETEDVRKENQTLKYVVMDQVKRLFEETNPDIKNIARKLEALCQTK